MRRIRHRLEFRPLTCWSGFAGVASMIYLLAAGLSVPNLVRAADAGFLLIVMGLVLSTRTYYAAANARTRDPDRGALPRHVGKISLSYLLLLIFAVIEVWVRADDPLSWRVPLLAIAGVLGVQALIALIDFERRRVFFVSPFVTDLRGSPHDERRR